MAGPAFSVESSDFKAFSRALRNADKDLQNEMRRALRAEINTTRDALRSRDWAPVEAGLKSKWGTRGQPIKRGKTNIATKVSSTKANVNALRSRSMSMLNRGFVRHPGVIYDGPGKGEADRKHWYSTAESTATGWWDRGVDREAPRISRAVQDVLDTYAAKLAAKITTGRT